MHTEQNAPHNHITLCDVPPLRSLTPFVSDKIDFEERLT